MNLPIQNNKLDATRHREDMFAHVMSQLETDILHKEIDGWIWAWHKRFQMKQDEYRNITKIIHFCP